MTAGQKSSPQTPGPHFQTPWIYRAPGAPNFLQIQLARGARPDRDSEPNVRDGSQRDFGDAPISRDLPDPIDIG